MPDHIFLLITSQTLCSFLLGSCGTLARESKRIHSINPVWVRGRADGAALKTGGDVLLPLTLRGILVLKDNFLEMESGAEGILDC